MTVTTGSFRFGDAAVAARPHRRLAVHSDVARIWRLTSLEAVRFVLRKPNIFSPSFVFPATTGDQSSSI